MVTDMVVLFELVQLHIHTSLPPKASLCFCGCMVYLFGVSVF